jgi:hypothetical protein
MRLACWILLLAPLATACTPQDRPQASDPLAASRFSYSDVLNFYKVYDSAGGKPSAAALQTGYLDLGSPAVRDFTPNRIVSAQRLAAQVANEPAIYQGARECLGLMPAAQASFRRSTRRFRALYPEAVVPNVSFVIGANNSGGTSGPSGLIMGLEVICRSGGPSRRPIRDRLNSLVAHEAAHASQSPTQNGTLLAVAIREGVPELVAELTTGEILNDHLKIWTRGREAQIERDFRAQMDGRDFKNWVYNGIGTPEKPGDLAYWVGYRIARSYYNRAGDKRTALKRLLTDEDYQGILRDSGWSEQG